MAAIANDWLVPMSGEFKKPYYRKLYETVKSEYETKEVYPAPDDIFNAFAFTPLSKVKVVILGQDPSHEPGQAHGLSFSVKPSAGDPPPIPDRSRESARMSGRIPSPSCPPSAERAMPTMPTTGQVLSSNILFRTFAPLARF